jgi:hypothetical protein
LGKPDVLVFGKILKTLGRHGPVQVLFQEKGLDVLENGIWLVGDKQRKCG